MIDRSYLITLRVQRSVHAPLVKNELSIQEGQRRTRISIQERVHAIQKTLWVIVKYVVVLGKQALRLKHANLLRDHLRTPVYKD